MSFFYAYEPFSKLKQACRRYDSEKPIALRAGVRLSSIAASILYSFSLSSSMTLPHSRILFFSLTRGFRPRSPFFTARLATQGTVRRSRKSPSLPLTLSYRKKAPPIDRTLSASKLLTRIAALVKEEAAYSLSLSPSLSVRLTLDDRKKKKRDFPFLLYLRSLLLSFRAYVCT